MANKNSLGQKVASGGSPGKNPKVGVSAPFVPEAMTITMDSPETPHHLLSDEQLNSLSELAQDTSREWLMTYAGLVAGFLQNGAATFNALSEKKTPTLWDGLLTFVLAVCIVGLIHSGRNYYSSRNKLPQKIQTIRTREKKIVRNGEIQSVAVSNGSKRA